VSSLLDLEDTEEENTEHDEDAEYDAEHLLPAFLVVIDGFIEVHNSLFHVVLSVAQVLFDRVKILSLCLDEQGEILE